MAATRPSQASPSDPAARGVDADEPVPVRVVRVGGGATEERDGEAALAGLGGWIGRPDGSVWIDATAPTADQVRQIGEALGLHPLVVEDILEGNQRAKIESTDGVVHLVLFHLAYQDGVLASELDIVLGRGFLLTIHGPGWDPRATHHLANGAGPLLAHGADHLLWAIADDLIDGYFPFADRIGDAIDEIQDEVVRVASRASLERLFELKRELIQVRRAISPVREIFNQLTNRDEQLIDPEEIIFFRDVYDHVIRLTDELDTYRDLASATLEVYLSQVNNSLSVIMKRLTGVTVILAGIGAVAGIFGMSEAGTALLGREAGGFWLVTGIVVALAAVAAVILRRIDWI